MSRACFAAGTPLLTPEGSKPIEQFRPGDLVLSAPEHDPAGAVEPREVEEVFTRHWRLFALRVAGREIRTTAEHPFYVEGKGWTPASLLASGDLLRSHDGRWLPLESVDDTGQDAVVYSMRIAEYHTYFVGSAEWGFSVWSHNAACGTASASSRDARAQLQSVVDEASRMLSADKNLITTMKLLSRKEIVASVRPWVARMNYGKAIERLTAKLIGNSPRLSKLFQHLRGPGPDFKGTGRFLNQIFDITTEAGKKAHQARSYGANLKIATYARPSWLP